MKIYIKYMVSLRCKLMVKQELRKLGIKYVVIELGVVDILDDITDEQRNQLKNNLAKSGLELLDDQKRILIERIQNVVVEMIHYSDELPKVNFSEYISEKIGYDYTYLSNIFSEIKGITLQNYIIIHRIEKVKELLLYDELNLTEISYRLQYSSVAHLSNQFKKITGLTPTFYKHLKQKRVVNLENL
jgi:AraC-like DNA-binding protein